VVAEVLRRFVMALWSLLVMVVARKGLFGISAESSHWFLGPVFRMFGRLTTPRGRGAAVARDGTGESRGRKCGPTLCVWSW
jgi:hypothetical protein